MNRLAHAVVLMLAVAPLSLAAQVKTSVVPVGAAGHDFEPLIGLALQQVRQSTDALGTRPTVFVADFAVAMDQGYAGSVLYDEWREGNAQRSVFSAFYSETPVAGLDWSFSFRPPRRRGLTVEQHWRRAASTWLYLGVGWQRNEAKPVHFDHLWQTCDTQGLCAVPAHGTALFAAPPGAWGDFASSFRMWTARLGRVHDSRDNIFAPTNGRVVDISAAYHWVDMYGDPEPAIDLHLGLRNYRTTSSGGVLAFQAMVEFNRDRVPPGASRTFSGFERGLFATGAYRTTPAGVQLEWRSPTRWWDNRMGFAVFGSAVSLSDAAFAEGLRGSAGVGLRYRLDRVTRSTLRLDFGHGLFAGDGHPQKRAFILALQEAF